MQTIVAGRWNRHSSRYEETKNLHKVRELLSRGKATKEELKNCEDKAVVLLACQLETLGVDIMGDGGFRWDSIYDVARYIYGCGGFSQLTRIPNTNHFHRMPFLNGMFVKNPVPHKTSILAADLKYLKATSKKPVVISLPGPYTLSRQTENCADLSIKLASEYYAQVLNQEILMLQANGADYIRIEEPQIIDHPEDFKLFTRLMEILTTGVNPQKLILASWYGNVPNPDKYFALPFEMFMVDFVEGRGNLEALKFFPKEKKLIAGIFDARNVCPAQAKDYHSLIDKIASNVCLQEILLSPNTDLHFLPYNNALKLVETMVKVAGEYKKDDKIEHSFLEPEAKRDKPAVLVAQKADESPRKFLPAIPFITSTVGSFPQSVEVRSARRKLYKGELSGPEYRALIENHAMLWVEFQKQLKIDVPVDGEFLREDMAVHFGARIGGETLDFVPSYENRRYRPIAYPRVKWQNPISKDEFTFLKDNSGALAKATITGPATLADWGLIKEKDYYSDRGFFRLELAAAMREEMRSLIDSGAKIIQVDEPALTTKPELLYEDLEAIRTLIKDFDSKAYLILHICYSDFASLNHAFPHILNLPFHQIHMEMANRHYGLLKIIESHGFSDKDIGLGVIDVHTNRVETVEEIVSGVARVRKYFSPHKIWITPDCGLKERSDEVAKQKLEVMAKATERLRQELV